MDDSRRLGYDYSYRFWMDGDIISDAFVRAYGKTQKSFLIEFRANFILKKRRVDYGGGTATDDEIMESETYQYFMLQSFVSPMIMRVQLGFRLEEYWMPDHEIKKLCDGLFNFADEHAASASLHPTIPIVVGVDVCTVQQEGELVSAVMNRVIKPEFLIPLELDQVIRPNMPRNIAGRFIFINGLYALLKKLATIRVTDVDEGLALMEACPICWCKTTIGAQISLVPNCHHAFHTRCLVVWLMKKTDCCPLCRSPVKEVS